MEVEMRNHLGPTGWGKKTSFLVLDESVNWYNFEEVILFNSVNSPLVIYKKIFFSFGQNNLCGKLFIVALCTVEKMETI